MADEVFEDVYKFNGYKDWQHQIIEAGNKFFEKYKLQPQFIRIKDEVMDILFEEAEKALFEEAEEALKKYKSVRCDIEMNGNELISYGQFFIESKNKVLKVADWDEKEQNWTMLPESYFTEKR